MLDKVSILSTWEEMMERLAHPTLYLPHTEPERIVKYTPAVCVSIAVLQSQTWAVGVTSQPLRYSLLIRESALDEFVALRALASHSRACPNR